MRSPIRVFAAAAFIVALAGCSSVDDRTGARVFTGAAAGAAGGAVIGVLTGAQLKADGIGNLICGWMVHSKDGSPMKMGAWEPK